MARYLVTGGAGFIGSHIATALVEKGEQVRVLDSFISGKEANLGAIRGSIELIRGDICDAPTVQKAMEGVDIVFHQAALASVPLSIADPLATHRACVTGTVTVLDAAVKAKVKRLVYAASSSAYGDQPTSSKRETDLPLPLSPYAAAKLAGEYYLQSFYHSYGLETVGLRYFNVFGPRQDPDSPYSAVIPIFVSRILSGLKPVVYGDGMQSRDFTYVANVVQGNLLASEAPGVAGKILNLADGRQTTLLRLIELLSQMLEVKIDVDFQPARVGDVRESLADVTLARKLLGYNPQYSLETGLANTIEYYKKLVSARKG